MPNLRPITPPLPATLADLRAGRIIKTKVTFNDLIEPLYEELYDGDPLFKQLIEGVHNDETVEGSTAADDYRAADMLRSYADKRGVHLPSKWPERERATWEEIAHAIKIVSRRFNASRKQRKHQTATWSPPTPANGGGTDVVEALA